MNVDEKFPSRLLGLRSALGLTQSELAKLVGVAQRTIASYEIGESTPRLKALLRLASALRVTPEMLSTGVEKKNSDEESQRKTSNSSKVPVLTDEQIISRYMGGVIFEESERLIHTDIQVSSSSFAYLVRDDSMINSEGGEYSFPPGSVIVFDPSLPSRSGDFVLVVLGGANPLVFFRRFAGGMEVVNFSPLNTSYPKDEVSIVSLREDSIRVIPAVLVTINLQTTGRNAISSIGMQVATKADYPSLSSYKENDDSSC